MQDNQDELEEEATIAPLPNFIPLDAPLAKVPEQAQKDAEFALAAVVEELELNGAQAVPAHESAVYTRSNDFTENVDTKPILEPSDEKEIGVQNQGSSLSLENVLNKLATEINSSSSDSNELKEGGDKEISRSEWSSDEENTADRIDIDRDTYLTLMDVARKVNSGAVLVDPLELQRVNSVVERGSAQLGVTQPIDGTPIKAGVTSLGNGLASLVGGLGSVAGSAFNAGGQGLSIIGNAASKLVNDLAGNDKSDDKEVAVDATRAGNEIDRKFQGVAVLPRLSDYRVEQAEKASNAYEKALHALWESGDLPNVRRELEERARTTGLSVEDVMDKMRPNGEMADLHEKFIAAVGKSTDAQSQKKAMDKALDGWSRQYGRGQEEILNPETEGNPYLEGLRDRLDKTGYKMQKNAGLVPAFEDEDKSHAEKLRERIAKIAEKIKEIVKDVVNMVRGRSADTESSNAPSP